MPESAKRLILLLIIALSIASCNKKENASTEPVPNPPVSVEKFITVIQDDYQSMELVLTGSESWNFIVSFKRKIDGQLLDFEAVDNHLPVIMKSGDGTEWNWFGRAVSGPQSGRQLTPVSSGMGYWFAFGALYPGAEIYAGESSSQQPPAPNDPEWLVSTKRIARATSFDGIQAIDQPAFTNFDEQLFPGDLFYIKNKQLVVGLDINDQVGAYPHAILDWHEIVNDDLSGTQVSVIYCPLTGTTAVWDRLLDNGLTTFGVSGLLYNSNIMPFDRATESIWTQLDGRCVNGVLKGERVNRFHFVETTWETWKSAYDKPRVMNEYQEGFNFDYQVYPYGDYITNHQSIAFPVEVNDNRLPSKERVHGVLINGRIKVYRFSSF